MRIGFDARVICQKQVKGIGRYLTNLLQALVDHAGRNEIFLFVDQHSEFDSEESGMKRIHLVKVASSRNGGYWEQFALPKAVRDLRIDVFHSPSNTMMGFPPCPVVLTLHDAMSHRLAKQWGMKENFYWNILQRFAYSRALKIITPSEFARKQLIDELRLPHEKITVVHQGISPVFNILAADETNKRILQNQLPAKYILALGSNLERKNIGTLLQAFDLIADRTPVELVVTGAMGCERIQHQYQSLKNKHRVKLLDYVSENELVAFYNKSDLFVFPSLEEGFGFPPLEAMACGAPVVASNASCIPEVVGDAAYLVDCRRPEPLAEAILKMLTDITLRTSFKTKGIEHAKKYRWETAAKKTLEVYEEAVRK